MLQSSPRAAHQASPLKPTGRHFHLPLPLRNVPYGCRRKWRLSFPPQLLPPRCCSTPCQLQFIKCLQPKDDISALSLSFPSWFADKLYPRHELPGQLPPPPPSPAPWSLYCARRGWKDRPDPDLTPRPPFLCSLPCQIRILAGQGAAHFCRSGTSPTQKLRNSPVKSLPFPFGMDVG